jgi:hypothetical protein
VTINLDSAGALVGILVGMLTLAGFAFAVLRYVIRAETSELRHNGGSSLKDAVVRTEKKLDAHMADSRARVKRGAEVEDELRKAISGLAEALPVVAASTPPEG